ncbi:MAG TPA: NAD+ synthase [Actinobacteria bacterium]|nr:NAD+ synthase [Actinomycetota bacterium]
MTEVLRVAVAQYDFVVGDLEGNEARILEAMARAEAVDADVLVLPELALSGYPPEDLVLRDSFVAANRAALERLAAASGSTAVVVGFVDRATASRVDDAEERTAANAAAVLAEGRIAGIYHKVLLPNYGVFDEARVFAEGDRPDLLFEIRGVPVGVSICEDIWVPDGPTSAQVAAGARLLLNLNGSPYHLGKTDERTRRVVDQARRTGTPVVYVNTVGGQDELVFDGDSMVVDAHGEVFWRAPRFVEEFAVVDVAIAEPRPPRGAAVPVTGGTPARRRPSAPPTPEPMGELEEEVFTALVTGLRDYVRKNGFPEVVVGLSGGIDSSLTAVIAADALGARRVRGVTMPSRYSSEGSVLDSRDLAGRLGIRFSEIPIDDVFQAYLDTLAPSFAGREPNVAEENLQARIRGAILMALTNKFGGIVVATGNKSEMAVGYATLYGDMVGGFAVIKDVYKTFVYRLARWRNTVEEVIPQAVLDKPPSAELRPGQKDTDTLPPYEILDGILERYIEEDRSVASIVADGFDVDTVRRVVAMVDRNEYKRRQAPPGVKITRKAFGRDRRLPITNRFRG